MTADEEEVAAEGDPLVGQDHEEIAVRVGPAHRHDLDPPRGAVDVEPTLEGQVGEAKLERRQAIGEPLPIRQEEGGIIPGQRIIAVGGGRPERQPLLQDVAVCLDLRGTFRDELPSPRALDTIVASGNRLEPQAWSLWP